MMQQPVRKIHSERIIKLWCNKLYSSSNLSRKSIKLWHNNLYRRFFQEGSIKLWWNSSFNLSRKSIKLQQPVQNNQEGRINQTRMQQTVQQIVMQCVQQIESVKQHQSNCKWYWYNNLLRIKIQSRNNQSKLYSRLNQSRNIHTNYTADSNNQIVLQHIQ